jgi:hypothetical protein
MTLGVLCGADRILKLIPPERIAMNGSMSKLSTTPSQFASHGSAHRW